MSPEPLPTTKPPAVVVGLDSMQGLQVCRILAAEGVPVYAVSKNPEYYGNKTRACREIHCTDTGGDELLDLLDELASRFEQKAVLIPCQDKNVLVISRNRQRLDDNYHVLLPEVDVVEQLMDKARFADLAKRFEIPIPASFEVTTREQAAEAAAAVPYPCVVKPPNRSREWLRHTKAKAIRAADAEELMRIYDTVSGWVETLVIQEWVEGTDQDLYSFNGWFDRDSRPLATFIAKKLRQYPPEIGQSCLGVEVKADEVLEASLRLFESVGMVGFAYLEMKRHARTGRFYAIEPNIGRPTGRSPIAEAGGVQLHYLAYCDAAGLPLPPIREQTFSGAKWIHLARDTQSAWYYYRRGELSAGEWLRSIQGHKAYAVASLRDPMPFLQMLAQGAKDSLSRDRRRTEVINV